MIFKKVSEYLFQIFESEEENADFNLFFSNKFGGYIGGILRDTDEAYLLSRDENQFGIKIDQKYIFMQNRTKFVDAEKFSDIIKNDEYLSESEIREKFKDIEYVELVESDLDKGVNTVTKLSYLVNKGAYLLINYQECDNRKNLSATMQNKILTLKNLESSGLLTPPEEKKVKKGNMVIDSNQHFFFDITNNGNEQTVLFLRRSFIQKIYNYMIDANEISKVIKIDSQDCIETVKENLIKKFGKDAIEGR